MPHREFISGISFGTDRFGFVIGKIEKMNISFRSTAITFPVPPNLRTNTVAICLPSGE
jgi:hypothetical protein